MSLNLILHFVKKNFKSFAPTSCVSPKTSLFSSKFHALSNSYESSGNLLDPEIYPGKIIVPYGTKLAGAVKKELINRYSIPKVIQQAYITNIFLYTNDIPIFSEHAVQTLRHVLFLLNRFLFQTPLGDCSCIFAANLKESCHAQIQIKTKGGQVSPFSRKDLGAAIKSNNQAMDYVGESYLDRGCRLKLFSL